MRLDDVLISPPIRPERPGTVQTHVYAVRPEHHIARDRRPVRERGFSPLRGQGDDLARSVQPGRRTLAVLGRGELLELLVQTYPVAEQPGVLPHAVGDGGIDVLEDLARVLALLDALGDHGAKLLGEDAPSPQHAVAIGCEVDGGACLVGEP